MRKTKRGVIILILILLTSAVIIFSATMVYGMLCPAKTNTSPAVKVYTVEELVSSYEKNPEGWDETYKFEECQVTGTVEAVYTKDEMLDANPWYVVALKHDEIIVEFSFSSGSREAQDFVQSLAKGKRISVAGYCDIYKENPKTVLLQRVEIGDVVFTE